MSHCFTPIIFCRNRSNLHANNASKKGTLNSLENVLAVFNLLKLILGSYDNCGLVGDDVLRRANKFPHRLSDDSPGRARCPGLASETCKASRTCLQLPWPGVLLLGCWRWILGWLWERARALPSVGPPSPWEWFPLGTQRKVYIAVLSTPTAVYRALQEINTEKDRVFIQSKIVGFKWYRMDFYRI
jgi:hypothetical protein